MIHIPAHAVDRLATAWTALDGIARQLTHRLDPASRRAAQAALDARHHVTGLLERAIPGLLAWTATDPDEVAVAARRAVERTDVADAIGHCEPSDVLMPRLEPLAEQMLEWAWKDAQ